VEGTTFNPSRNRRIIAPPFLKLEFDVDDSATSSVKYFLREADFRKEVRCGFMGQELVYGDIDGGDTWGRRKEVRMLIDPNEGRSVDQSVISAIDELMLKAHK
jgi:SLS1 protein C-terminal beta barrel domain